MGVGRRIADQSRSGRSAVTPTLLPRYRRGGNEGSPPCPCADSGRHMHAIYIDMNKPHWRSSEALQLRARQLRRAMTPAEVNCGDTYGMANSACSSETACRGFLYRGLLCAKAELVVEVDGDSHGDLAEAEYIRNAPVG